MREPLMRIAFYTNNISPHQLPLAHAVARRVGYENFLYVDDAIAWRRTVVDAGAIAARTRAEAGDELETCDVLYTCQRDLDLLERRAKRGLATFYYSERWFKPLGILPGWLRMLVPGYRRMAKRFVVWANGDPGAKVLAVGRRLEARGGHCAGGSDCERAACEGGWRRKGLLVHEDVGGFA